MALDLKGRQNKTAPIVVKFTDADGEKVTIKAEYYRGRASSEWYQTLGREPVRVKLAAVLLSWDVTEDGKPFMPDLALPYEERVAAWEALLAPLEQLILREVLDGILDDLNPSKDAVKN